MAVKQMKNWHKQKLTKAGKEAKALVVRICKALSKESGRGFHVEMNAWNNTYEGHIIDEGKCIEGEDGEYVLSTEGDDIGMIFFGGYYSRKHYADAQSRAWVSLLEDCIGQSDVSEFHNLTESLKTFGPRLDFNCKSAAELDALLVSLDC